MTSKTEYSVGEHSIGLPGWDDLKTECSVGEHSTGLPGWDDLKDRVFSGQIQHWTSTRTQIQKILYTTWQDNL